MPFQPKLLAAWNLGLKSSIEFSNGKTAMKYVLALIVLLPGACVGQQGFNSIEQMLGILPIAIRLKEGRAWQQQAADLANQQLGKQVVGKALTATLKFSRFESVKEGLYGPAVVGSAEVKDISAAGATVRLQTYVYFSPDQLSKLGLIKSGTNQTFTGTVGRCEFLEAGRVLVLDVRGALLGAVDLPAQALPKGRPMEILSATYGSGGGHADVTARVKEKLELKRENLVARPQDLGADPTPGWNKQLNIVYTKDGRQRMRSYGENSSVIWQSFWGPQDMNELKEWMTTIKAHCWNGEMLFKADGTFTSPFGAGWWNTTGDRHFILRWGVGQESKCEFNFEYETFQETGGMNGRWTIKK